MTDPIRVALVAGVLGLTLGCGPVVAVRLPAPGYRVARVDRLPAPIEQLVVGADRSCALVDHQAWCWGQLMRTVVQGEQLGPARLDWMPAWVSMSVGEYGESVCGIEPDGRVSCTLAGDQRSDQRGRGLVSLDATHVGEFALPVAPARALTGGLERGCLARASDGRVWCWASRSQLGPCDDPSGRGQDFLAWFNQYEVEAGAARGWWVPGTRGVIALANGAQVVCARDGVELECWAAPTSDDAAGCTRQTWAAPGHARGMQIVGEHVAARIELDGREVWRVWRLGGDVRREVWTLEPGVELALGRRHAVLHGAEPGVELVELETRATRELTADMVVVASGAGARPVLIDDHGRGWSVEPDGLAPAW